MVITVRNLVIPDSQSVTSRCLFAVYTIHISGKYVRSQFDRKFDFLFYVIMKPQMESVPSGNNIFITQQFIVTHVMKGSCL